MSWKGNAVPNSRDLPHPVTPRRPAASAASSPRVSPSRAAWSGGSRRSSLASFDSRRETSEAERCRAQAEDCHRLLLLAESGAEATILTSLWRSWKMIANQTDRYIAIMKKQAAQKG
jgi:hypothetical protein